MCVQRSKETSTTGHTTTGHLAPIGFQGATLFQLWNRSGGHAVPTEMNDGSVNQSSATRVWIPIGAALFLIALTVSAWVVPQLRLLHLLQAFIYVVIVILARRNSAWGFGAGVTIGVVWNSLNLFVTHLMQAGAVAFWFFVHTGQVRRPETMMVTLGGIGHFILIIACLAALFHQTTEDRKWWKFVGGGAWTLVYFSLIIAVARPR
jgi:hypothetical protein